MVRHAFVRHRVLGLQPIFGVARHRGLLYDEGGMKKAKRTDFDFANKLTEFILD